VQNLPDKHKAADSLAALDMKLRELIAFMEHTDARSHPGFIRLKRNFKGKLSERVTGSTLTSYTVNKGDEVHMCLRQSDNSLIDENTIFFVALHEMAHIMTESFGHTAEFRENFKTLLTYAVDHNLYRYEPYHENNKEYCGMKIRNNPLKQV
jgi:hypothetical protein